MFRPLEKFNAILLTINQNCRWYFKLPLFLLFSPLFLIYGVANALVLLFFNPYHSFELWKVKNNQGTVVVSYSEHINFKRNVQVLSLASSVIMVASFLLVAPYLSTQAAAPNAPSSLGSADYVTGATVTDSSPSLTFTLADADNDQVRYRIQIDDSADFGSLVIDYTSGLADVGARTFTVGQAAGTGSYAVGTAGAYLPYGSYYWRVQAIDVHDEISAYTTANGGSLAFILQVYTVTKTADTNDGACNADCSFREAITVANASADTNKLIEFNIPAEDAGCVETVCTITPTSVLPAFLANNIVVNGYSQPGAIANTNDFPLAMNSQIKIILDGVSAGATRGLAVNNKSGGVIKGLSIIRFNTYGIHITNTSSVNNKVQGCFLGVRPDGVTVAGNGYGVVINGGANNNIVGVDGDGLNDVAERNLISGNTSQGVWLGTGSGSNSTVSGNFIGTDLSGTLDLGNIASGIKIETGANTNIIGTDGDGVYDQGEGNLVSGNNSYGIYSTGNGDIIAGNIVGCDATGNNRLQNEGESVGITGNNTRVGTNADGISDTYERNYVCGNPVNPKRGVSTSGSGTLIKGNYFGVNFTGSAVSGPAARSVELTSLSSNCVVGTDGDGVNDAVEGNVISGGVLVGIIITGGTGHRISGNIIGLNPSGTVAVDSVNSQYGIRIYGGSGYTIGTNADGVSDALERNIVAGHMRAEIIFEGAATDVIVAGNYLGTDITGQQALGFGHGIQIGNPTNNVSGNRIGTNGDGVNDAAERNIISGNLSNGINIFNANGTVIAGNYIGLAADGITALSNKQHGVFFDNLGLGASGIVIGGDIAAEGNIIANNGDAANEYGVYVTLPNSDNNQILRNSFYNNYDLGIKLNQDGANNDLAAPQILYEAPAETNRLLRGAAKANSTVQLFAASADNEGQTLLNQVTADGAGKWNVTLTAPSGDIGKVITATATDGTDGTSEFSTPYTIAGYDGNIKVAFQTSTSTDTEATLNRQITVQLSQSNYLNTSVDYAVTGGTATSGGTDYTLTSGTLTIPAGSTSANISYTVSDDVINENDETIIVTLSNPVNATLGSTTVHTATITDNDGAPVVANVNVEITENTVYSGTLTHTNGGLGPFIYSLVTNGSHGRAVIINSATGTFTYTPDTNYTGTDVFSYKVNDGLDDSNTATFTITMNEAHHAPVFSGGISVLAWDEDTTQNNVFDLDNYFSDVDAGDVCTYSLSDDPALNVLATWDSGNRVSFTPVANWNGADTVKFRCTDPSGLTAETNSIALNVNPKADRPVAVFNNVTTPEAAAFNLDGSGAYDVDGDTLLYEWTEVTDSADGCGLAQNNIVNPSLNLANRESNFDCVYQLVVNDGTLSSDPVTGIVSVNAQNDQPQFINLTNQINVTAGEHLVLVVQANDADSSSLSLAALDVNQDFAEQAVNLAQLFTDNTNDTGTFNWIPSDAQAGEYLIGFQASDGVNNVTFNVEIIVAEGNQAPVLKKRFPNIALNSNTVNKAFMDLDNYFSDPEGGELTYKVKGAKLLAVDISAAGLVKFTTQANLIGDDEIYFVAEDAAGETKKSNKFIVNVQINPEASLNKVDYVSGRTRGKGTVSVYGTQNTLLKKWHTFSVGGAVPRLLYVNQHTYVAVVKRHSGTTMHIYNVNGKLKIKKRLSPDLHPRRMAIGELNGDLSADEIVVSSQINNRLYFKLFSYTPSTGKVNLLKRHYAVYPGMDYRLIIKDSKVISVINGLGEEVANWQPF